MAQADSAAVWLRDSQIEEGAQLLARAFQHDPMMQYFVGSPARMLDRPMRMYRASIRLALRDGEVHTTPDLKAISVWIKPDNTDMTFRQLLRSGMIGATFSMGLRTVMRFMRSYETVEKIKKAADPGRHWLLMFLGVDPDRQCQGLGGKLMLPILERADREKTSCYLESMNERNLSFYRRFGFEVTGEAQIPGGGPNVWAMCRRPGGTFVDSGPA